jgi:hypothetical protein
MNEKRMNRHGFAVKTAVWLVTLGLFSNVLAMDTIITKQNRKYQGKVVKNTEKGFVIQTLDGSMVVLAKSGIAKIYRDNKLLDFETGMSYYVEVKRPFLPLGILGIGSGIYAVNRFQAYQDNRREAAKYDTLSLGAEYLGQSKKNLALGIVSTIVSLGSFYIALRPLEMKVPIGKIRMSAVPGGLQLALDF